MKPISALCSQESSTGSHTKHNHFMLLPISLHNMNTKDYLRVRAIEKWAKIVPCRNSLINQKPVGKLSFTTDRCGNG